MGRSEGVGRIADIEVLRAVAVLMVLVAHMRGTLAPWPTPVWDHVAAAYFEPIFGVDLFFAISGFVIARNLLPAVAAAEDVAGFCRLLAGFWVRRAFRLLPSAWVWLWIGLACSAFFNQGGFFGPFGANFHATLAGMLACANLRLIRVFGEHPGVLREIYQFYGVSTHYWSLSLEEQFYCVLPLLAWLLRRRLLAVVALGLAVAGLVDGPALNSGFRIHALLAGVLLAGFAGSAGWAVVRPVFLQARPLWGFCVLALGVLLLAALGPLFERIVLQRNLMVALISFLLVLVAGHNLDVFRFRPWLDGVLQWCGSRSYALYLVHPMMLAANREAWLRWGPAGFGSAGLKLGFMACGIGLIAGCAELNYRFLETPLRKRGAALAARFVAPPLAEELPA